MGINENKPWTKEDEQCLKENASKLDLARKLGRTEAAIRNKADEIGASLKPKDK